MDVRTRKGGGLANEDVTVIVACKGQNMRSDFLYGWPLKGGVVRPVILKNTILR